MKYFLLVSFALHFKVIYFYLGEKKIALTWLNLDFLKVRFCSSLVSPTLSLKKTTWGKSRLNSTVSKSHENDPDA